MKKISEITKKIIVAVSENNVIGKDGEIPWHFPEDLKHFKEKTTGNSVVMGRKTFESLPEEFRPLPNRKNIVLTRKGLEKTFEDLEEAKGFEQAWELAREYSDTVFVIGGETVYRDSIPYVDEILLTRIHEEYEGDTFFPKLGNEWIEKNRDEGEKLSFITYRRE